MPRVTPKVTPTPTFPPVTAPWVFEGSLEFLDVSWWDSSAGTVLADGDVLFMQPDGLKAAVRDARSGAWRAVPGLAASREGFRLVALPDGRALAVGGTNADGVSFSSVYGFDPTTEAWRRVGLLNWARSYPGVALLPDGRVLVAGGYYLTGASEGYGATIDAEVVAHRATPRGPSEAGQPPRADLDPGPPIARALATAELFDPATGELSTTRPMSYARFGAPAVTLSDGRVLVVGSIDGWENRVSGTDERSQSTAEIYDPAIGRFGLTGEFPSTSGTTSLGTLVALAGGNAALVGQIQSCKHCPDHERHLQYQVRTDSWRTVEEYEWGSDWARGFVRPPANISRSGAAVAALASDQVLVAGGLWFDKDGDSAQTASAELFDPRTDRWLTVSPMPEPRAGALAVALADGSVLVVGGRNATTPTDWRPCSGPIGLPNAIRYVPEP